MNRTALAVAVAVLGLPNCAFSQDTMKWSDIDCAQFKIAVQALNGLSYVGNGKMYFDSTRNRIAEPEFFDNGLGVGTWTRGDSAFTPHFAVRTTLYSHWAAIVLDKANTMYMVWDTDNGSTNANQIELVYSKDFGTTWSKPWHTTEVFIRIAASIRLHDFRR